MSEITRGWPPARRKAQAERIRETKPWLNASGPQSDEGKEKVKYNAWKHGGKCAEMQRIREVLRRQRAYLEDIGAR